MSRPTRISSLHESHGSRDYGLNFATELVHQLVIPAFVLDAEHRVIVWNEACERLTGMGANELLGTSEHWRAFYGERRPCLADLVVDGRHADIDRFYAAHDLSIDSNLGAHAENWCIMPLRGTELYLEIDAGPIRDTEGRIVAVVETLRDMTFRKHAEDTLHLHASVFENSQEGILITDANGLIISVNGAFTAVTGYGVDEIRGRSPSFLQSGLQPREFYEEMWRSLLGTGQWHGELWNRKKNGEFYAELLNINAVRNSEGQVINYVGMFSDITDLKKTQDRLLNLANYDALTGLPNRMLLSDRLRQAISAAKRYNYLLAICFLDLDGFKPINDRYGHDTGDRFLVEMANRLKQALRGGDTVARLGGDEFVLLLAEFERLEEVEPALERILRTVSKPHVIDGTELSVSASVGFTIVPFDDSDPDTLLRHADQAMYIAKEAGRNRYHLFDTQESLLAQQRTGLIERIRQALHDREFRLHYQPQVDMRSGRVVGVEALIRWQHPERGLIAPLEFLPVVEQTPLIIDIGEWVLREALTQLRTWNAAGLTLSVGINIAARHFQHLDFVPRLTNILAAFPEVPPQQLELEIIESAALDDIDTVRNVISACQNIGVSFALDDFGTGYSSLTYLKRLPADTLKIDKSFVLDMLDDQEDLAIVEGVVGLATAFRMHVIAEGVETAEHGVLLMRLGCDRAQGYGIAKPMPAEAVAGWVATHRPDPNWLLWADTEWDRRHLPLVLAQYDHIKWLKRVVDSIDRPELLAAEDESVDYRHCRFGNWYFRAGRDSYGGTPAFVDIDLLHQRVHQVAEDLVRRRDDGDREGALALREPLTELSEQMLVKLAALQRAVAGNGT